MIVYFLSGKNFLRSREHEILVPLSILGVWRKIIKNLVDECASHMTLFIQALSLELVALAITITTCLLVTDFLSGYDHFLN